jgi:hypothetical protein
MAEEDVQVRFGASIEGLNVGIAQVREMLQGLTEPLRGVRDNLGEVAEAFVAAFAIEKIADFVKEMAELGEQAIRTSEMLGMTVEQVTALQGASKLTGGNADQMTSMLERLSRTMAMAAEGGKTQIAAFKEAGVSYKDAEGHLRPLNDMLADLANRFKEAPDGPEKTALAMTLMGRAGAEAIPLLNKGAEGLAELAAVGERTGTILSGDVAEGMAKTAEKNNELALAIQGFGENLFQFFKPAIDAIVTALSQWIEGMTAGLKGSGSLQTGVQMLALAFDVLISVILGVVEVFKTLWTVGEGILKGLSDGLLSLGKAAMDAISANWSAVPKDLSAGWKKLGDDVQTTGKSMADIAIETQSNIASMFMAQMGVGGPKAATDQPNNPLIPPPKTPPPGGGTDKIDAAKAEIDGEIKVLQEGLARKQLILADELKLHKINDQQYAQLSQEAVDTEYQAELALLQKELAINGLKLTQRQELLNKIKELEQKHAMEITKIQLKAADDAAKAWQKVGDTIAASFNSQISGLLKGTETIGQALKNIGLDLITQVIQNAVKSLMASAAQTFGGIFAFLAPTMGPAAAGPAAVGEAAVTAAGAGLSSLAVGTWGLPSDSPVMAHQGEMITPAFESDRFRKATEALEGMGGGSGGGGHTFNFHGPVLDKNGLVKMIVDTLNRNPSMRPAY